MRLTALQTVRSVARFVALCVTTFLYPMAFWLARIVCTLLVLSVSLPRSLRGQGAASISPFDITIARDSFGVPHIFGPTNAHVAYGLAWAHCEDNFNAIQRRLAFSRARLGEIEGKSGAASDFFVHFIRARDQVDSTLHLLDERTSALLSGYVQGLNAYAEQHPREQLVRGLFPATIQDILTGYVGVLAGMTGLPVALKNIYEGHPEAFSFPPLLGSNAFAFKAARTTDSLTTLIINPHLPIQGDHSLWEAHVSSDEGWNVCGALFPGMVTPAMGATPHHAYAMTFNWPDYVDIYKLRINPRNPNQYAFNGQWLNLDVRKVKLKVKVGGVIVSVTKEVLHTVYGPTLRTSSGVFATAFAHNRPILAVTESFQFGNAVSLAEFQAALDIQALPLFNIFYADREDNIFYQFNALLPDRQPGFPWQGVLPGDTSATCWGPYLSRQQLPQYENPNCGVLYNTNNTPFHATPCPEDNLLENGFSVVHNFGNNRANNRDLRVRELMMPISPSRKFTLGDILTIKYDATYPAAGTMRRITACVLDSLRPEDYTGILAEAVRLAKSWNFSGSPDNPQAALVLLTMVRVFKVFHADYGSVERGICIPQKLFLKHLRDVATALKAKYGRIDVPLAHVQFIRKGTARMGVGGLPESLCAMYADETKPLALEVHTGESYIGVARYDSTGLVSFETVTAFGQSSNPNSPHYADQMGLYSKHKRKRMCLDREEILQNAMRTYPPTVEAACGH